MPDAAFIGGDWGTSCARFWLCDADGSALDMREGRGVADLAASEADFSAHFTEMTAHWPADIPAIVCGAVGSNIGWQDAGYAALPLSLDEPGNNGVHLREKGRTVTILAGVKGINPIGEIDVMRGEETQVIGACRSEVEADAIFALPGTHNKWVRVSENRITHFLSSISGEMFGALSKHSVLVTRQSEPALGPAFEDGVELALTRHGADLLSLLFTVRARCATGRLSDADASDFLSGLIIGADIAAASGTMGLSEMGPVRLIGAGDLVTRYACALRLAGYESLSMSGSHCARTGLAQAWHRLRD